MKYCVQCKWHSFSTAPTLAENTDYDKCAAPRSFVDTDLVSGAPLQKYYGFCKSLRANDDFCGLAAAWFEPLSPSTDGKEDVEDEGTQ